MGIVEKYQGYENFLADLKQRIQHAQVKAVTSVNTELLNLYWQIGRDILDRQSRDGWGAGVVDRLARDLKSAMPGQTGFSVRNLKYMRTFDDLWSNVEVVQAPLAQLTWYHHIALIDKLSDPTTRIWYANKTAQNGWSRNVLVLQIEANLMQPKVSRLTTSSLP